jgi:hypothetical protein
MVCKVTFVASDSAEFKAYIVGMYEEVPIVEIPINTQFDYSPYTPAYVWESTSHRIMIVANDGATILSVLSDPPYTVEFTEFDGAFFSDGLKGGTLDCVATVVAQGGSVVTASPYNRVYKVDAGIIQNFSDIIARPPGSEVNLSDYVVTLLSIPFEIPSEFVGTEAPIVLGEVITQVEAPILTTDLLPISLGEIVVAGFVGNSLDYVATDYTLVLPYVADEITLEPQWVVNETVSVQYVLDAYSGNLTINVFSTAQSAPVHTYKSSLGRVIPFKMFGDKMESSMGSIQGVDNGVLSAYIRVQRKVLTQGEFSNLVTLEVKLGELQGFVSVENVNLVCGGTASEKQEVIRQLKNGVYIK